VSRGAPQVPADAGGGPQLPRTIDEHVEADAVHEAIAAVDLAGGLARQGPELTADILWGAHAARRLGAEPKEGQTPFRFV